MHVCIEAVFTIIYFRGSDSSFVNINVMIININCNKILHEEESRPPPANVTFRITALWSRITLLRETMQPEKSSRLLFYAATIPIFLAGYA